MKVIGTVAFVLVLIGALNWGLVGLLDFNLVTALLDSSLAQKVVYSLIGLAAVVMIVLHFSKKGG